METGNSGSELAQLRAEVAQLREGIKEREPSLLGASRTLLSDYVAWKKGERDFPRSALIGAVLAYLRPRIVLEIGSVVALACTVATLVLLSNQNGLLDRQNTLISRQGDLLEAQTTALLGNGLSGNDEIPPYQLALLQSYGDLGFEPIVRIAADPGTKAGEAARQVLISTAPKLRKDQAVKALVRLFDVRLTKLIQLGEHVEVNIRIGESTPPRVLAPMSIVGPLADSARIHLNPDLFVKQDWLGQFLYARQFTAEDFAGLTPLQRTYVLRRLALYYAANIGNGNSTGPPLAEEMAALCRALAGNRAIQLNSVMRAEVSRRSDSRTSVLRVVSEIVGRECSPKPMDLYTIPAPFDYENVTRDQFVDFGPVDMVYVVDDVLPHLGPPPASVESLRRAEEARK